MSSNARGSTRKDLRACPSCRSSETIRTHEQFGEQLFFCANCEHTWAIREGEDKEKRRKER